MRLKRAKDKQGEICFLIIDGDKELLVPVEDYKEAVMAGISNGTIKKQIVKARDTSVNIFEITKFKKD